MSTFDFAESNQDQRIGKVGTNAVALPRNHCEKPPIIGGFFFAPAFLPIANR